MSKRMLALAGCVGVFAGGVATVAADPVARVVIHDDGTANGTIWVQPDGAHYCGASGYYWLGPNYAPNSNSGAAGHSQDCPD